MVIVSRVVLKASLGSYPLVRVNQLGELSLKKCDARALSRYGKGFLRENEFN